MIDPQGYRPNVGIILCNGDGRVFWARRAGMDSWQFPQGGIKRHEAPEKAMYRELNEETGLASKHVEMLGCTKPWLRYQLPKRFMRKNTLPICIGQKQIWYLLRLLASEKNVCFDHSEQPEFDDWCWIDFWQPLNEVVYFKKNVYRHALSELGNLLMSDTVPVNPEGYLSEKHLHDKHSTKVSKKD